MSYQVLARKWRPRRFEDMVGQQHVLQALVHALDSNRLHHAYLFTGTRGVGKTTLARIFAKAVNCEQGISARPCGECSTCREIDEGRYVDLIEVDAASRTKVDETRDLLENVHYAPTRGRFKVYLIDEVHMFSNHSFNALLKTLEEPPPHVKFLLATTDPKKLPVTILSRCLQFNLKRLTPAQIEKHLENILAQESVESDRESRRIIAEAADGSVRDSLSLLDQAIAFGGGALRVAEVGTMLGTIDRQQVFDLLARLVEGDGAGLIAQARHIGETNADFFSVLAEMLSVLQRVAVVQVIGEAEATDSGEQISNLAARMPAEDCQLYYQIALTGRRDLPLSPDPAAGFEMLLLRMLAFQPVSASTPLASPPGTARPARGSTATAAPAVSGSPAVSRPTGQAPLPGPSAAGDAPSGNWTEMLNALQLNGRVRELAAQCVLLGVEGNLFKLALAPAFANLRSTAAEERLLQSIQARYGAQMRLQITMQAVDGLETPAQARDRLEAERQQALRAAIESDPNVVALKENFGAVVESITPRLES